MAHREIEGPSSSQCQILLLYRRLRARLLTSFLADESAMTELVLTEIICAVLLRRPTWKAFD